MDNRQVIANLIGKAIKLGLKTGRAWHDEAVGLPELEAEKTTLSSLSGIPGMCETDTPILPSEHLALVSGAFGAAIGRHWAGHRSMFSQHDQEADLRSTHAASKLDELVDNYSAKEKYNSVERLVHGPLSTPHYRCLWEAYTCAETEDESSDGGPPTPLLRDPGMHREFESHFLLAYWEGLSSQGGGSIGKLIDATGKHRREALHVLIAQKMATWGARHLFGSGEKNELGDASLSLPAEQIYVEPMARLSGPNGKIAPVLELLDDCIEKHRLTIIRGSCGIGKSLSARMLAREYALKYLEALDVSADVSADVTENVSAGSFRPVFIRCAQDFGRDEKMVKNAISRAQQDLAEELGAELKNADQLFPLDKTIDSEETLFILDGLDEIALSEEKMKGLFEELEQWSSKSHHFVVFSRPGAIPSSLPNDAALLEIQPFTTGPGGQVEKWLSNWRECAEEPAEDISEIAIAGKGLLKLCQTPILLLMVAHSWKDLQSYQGKVPESSVYEIFFRNIARGRIATDDDEESTVRNAAKLLSAALYEKGALVEPTCPSEDDELTDAMLWLMSRAAWEKHRLDYAEEPEILTTDKVVELVNDELGLTLETEEMGSIYLESPLFMKTDLRDKNHQIVLGHPSFVDFLVARYWAMQLGRLIITSGPEQISIESSLLGVPIVGSDRRVISFLQGIVSVQPWTHAERSGVRAWARECFKNDAQEIGDDPKQKQDDLRSPLRVAALAIGCSLSGQDPLGDVSGENLRSIITWYQERGLTCYLFAPGLQSSGADLEGAGLSRANLKRAKLEEADLKRARLEGADLEGANLKSADLTDAKLCGAKLKGADLGEANLEGANLKGAGLEGACLEEADLTRADLTNADLTEADLKRADLTGAVLVGATLEGADLKRANLTESFLENADLKRADLTGARLKGADLKGANFEGARLGRAKLFNADLTGADLAGADLKRANFGVANLEGADLSGADLKRADLTGADLKNSNLFNADLTGAKLEGANLTGANLEVADLKGANLEVADLAEANLEVADLKGAKLEEADLTGANLSGAELKRAKLEGAILRRANLGAANLEEADLTGAELKGADLKRAKLMEAKLGQAKLEGANLGWANLGWADLTGANLGWANLTEANLEGANLTEANLEGANLGWAKLEEADLTGANLGWAKLKGANLGWADLTGANLSWAKLKGARLEGAKLEEADLTGAKLKGADFKGAQLEEANLERADLEVADLKRANLERANLKESDLTGADLRRAIFKHAYLVAADLTGADLKGANLEGADLTGANLRRADLTGANLKGAILAGAMLKGANLTGINLKESDLKGADLGGAELTEADLARANLHDVDLSGANLTESNLVGADLTGANLEEASLVEADLTDAILERAILTDADLKKADLTGANLENADLRRADFKKSNLGKTNFEGANFAGADLEGADLTGSKLAKSCHDEYTSFPEGFDPQGREMTLSERALFRVRVKRRALR